MKKLTMITVLLGVICSGFFAVAQPPAGTSAVPEATTYQIRNVKFGDLLRPQDANNADGTRLVLYSAQPWKCMTWDLQPATTNAFHVRNLFTSKTFAVDDALAVIQVPLKKDSAQTPGWQFTKLEDGHYKITDAKSGQALTAVKGKIVAEAWTNRADQKWSLEKTDPKQLTM